MIRIGTDDDEDEIGYEEVGALLSTGADVAHEAIDDLAAVENGDELVARRLVLIDLEQLAFRKRQVSFRLVCRCGQIEMVLAQPGEKPYTLLKDVIAFEVIRRVVESTRFRQSWRKCLLKDSIHDELLHSLYRVVEFAVRCMRPCLACPHLGRNELGMSRQCG